MEILFHITTKKGTLHAEKTKVMSIFAFHYEGAVYHEYGSHRLFTSTETSPTMQCTVNRRKVEIW